MYMRMIASAVLVTAVSAALGEDMPWAKDWDSAKSAAAKDGKLIMVDFYTEWCGWCKKLDKDTYTNAEVIKRSAQIVPLKTDAEKEGKELAAKYGVKGYPTILFLDSSGEIFGRIGGYLPPKGFGDELNKIVDLHKRFAKIETALKAKPDDGESNAWMAVIMAARSKREAAEAALAKAEKAGYKGEVMAQAHNGIGDIYQNANDFEKAIGFFKKADVDGVKAADRAYAKVSILACLQSKGDTGGAKKVAQELVEMKDAPEEYVTMAKQALGK